MNEEIPSPSSARVLWLTLYYLAIIAGIIVLHSQGGFTTPKFIYQGF